MDNGGRESSPGGALFLRAAVATFEGVKDVEKRGQTVETRG